MSNRANFEYWHKKFYNRYEYKAKNVARTIWEAEAIGYTKEDIEQEFRMKLWSAIISFLKNWKEYKNGNAPRQVPMPFYLDRVLDNKKKDIIKRITREKQLRSTSSASDFDFGSNKDCRDTLIDFETKEAVLDGIDILIGLSDREKGAFLKFLRGHKMGTIQKLYKDIPDVNKRIRNQISLLKENYPELNNISNETMTYRVEEF